MNKESHIEVKLLTAAMMFATMIQKIMEENSDKLSKELTKFIENNPDATVEDITREHAKLVIALMTDIFKL